MKIAPLKNTDPWYARLSRENIDARTLRHVPVDMVVHMEAVEILHHGPEDNYRPYLHLRGSVEEVIPLVQLPYGVTSLPYKQGSEPQTDAFYEFDNAQLADLVAKDYFSSRFQVPGEMTDLQWELPSEIDVMIVSPEFADEAPLVFLGLHEQSSRVLDEQSSQYDLSDYFPNYSMPEQEQRVQRSQDVLTRSGEIKDLFADEQFEAPRYTDQVSPNRAAAQQQEVPTGLFNRLLQEIEEKRAVEEQRRLDAGEYDPNSAEGLYYSSVAPGVDAALAQEAAQVLEDSRESAAPTAQPAAGAVSGTEAEAEVADGDRDLDLDLDLDLSLEETADDLGVKPVETGAAERQAAHQTAARRQAQRRRAQLAGQEQHSQESETEFGQ